MVTAAVLTLLVGYVLHDTQMNIGIGVAITGIVGLVGRWTLVRRSPTPDQRSSFRSAPVAGYTVPLAATGRRGPPCNS